MKKNLTEQQLRNIVYNTIKESLIENGIVYYSVEDEADGAIKETTSDKEEAIADAQEMASTGGRFLVTCNGEVIFDTGSPSYKFESIKMTESQLRENIFNGIKNAIGDFNRGFKLNDEEPTDYKGVLSRCGYKVVSEKPMQGGKVVYTTQMSGPAAFGFAGDQPEEVVEALNRLYNKNIAQYLGRVKDKPYICGFKIIGI